MNARNMLSSSGDIENFMDLCEFSKYHILGMRQGLSGQDFFLKGSFVCFQHCLSKAEKGGTGVKYRSFYDLIFLYVYFTF